MKSVDQHCYDLAEWWFKTFRSKRGYLPQDVQELAESFQSAGEAAVADDEEDEG